MENFIREYKIDPYLCDELVRYVHKNPDKQFSGVTSSGVDKTIKDSTDVVLPIDDPLCIRYLKEIKECFNRYQDTFPSVAQSPPWGIVEGINLQWYKPEGGYFDWHTERCTYHGNLLDRRLLVWITYLNDVPNAGTEFKYYPELEVEAVKGKTIIWPVDWTHMHRGRCSRTNNKYIATGWMSFTNTPPPLIPPPGYSMEVEENQNQIDNEYIDQDMGIEKDGLGEMDSYKLSEQDNQKKYEPPEGKYEWPDQSGGNQNQLIGSNGIELDRFNSDTTSYR